MDTHAEWVGSDRLGENALEVRASHGRGLVWWQMSLMATSTSAGMSARVTARLA